MNPIRKLSPAERVELVESVSATEQRLVSALRSFSQDVLEAYYGFPLTLYRGVGYHLQPIADELFTSPSRPTFLGDGWESAVANFTLDPAVGEQFSDVLLAITLQREDVLAAPDLLTQTVSYFTEEDLWRTVPEGEVHVMTEAIGRIGREQLRIAGQIDTRLPEVVGRIPTDVTEIDETDTPLLEQDHHRAVRELALSYADGL